MIKLNNVIQLMKYKKFKIKLFYKSVKTAQKILFNNLEETTRKPILNVVTVIWPKAAVY